MGYMVDGIELATDNDGYLLEPDYRDEVATAIAAAEGIALTDAHWELIGYMRDQYREHGHTDVPADATERLYAVLRLDAR
jgi:TusE/DsrC/DsvC family sulfur relay protein